MYKIYYSKSALKQIPLLKAAKLDGKVKKLLALMEEQPFANPPRYETLKDQL